MFLLKRVKENGDFFLNIHKCKYCSYPGQLFKYVYHTKKKNSPRLTLFYNNFLIKCICHFFIIELKSYFLNYSFNLYMKAIKS